MTPYLPAAANFTSTSWRRWGRGEPRVEGDTLARRKQGLRRPRRPDIELAPIAPRSAMRRSGAGVASAARLTISPVDDASSPGPAIAAWTDRLDVHDREGRRADREADAEAGGRSSTRRARRQERAATSPAAERAMPRHGADAATASTRRRAARAARAADSSTARARAAARLAGRRHIRERRNHR